MKAIYKNVAKLWHVITPSFQKDILKVKQFYERLHSENFIQTTRCLYTNSSEYFTFEVLYNMWSSKITIIGNIDHAVIDWEIVTEWYYRNHFIYVC